MDFISWSVFGCLFVLAQFAVRTLYLLAIGLAFIYPAVANYWHAPLDVQLKALLVGVIVHMLITFLLGRGKSAANHSPEKSDIGQQVEVLEWLDEGSARVRYDGREWMADKARSEMPDADHGIIKGKQYGRLIITTE